MANHNRPSLHNLSRLLESPLLPSWFANNQHLGQEGDGEIRQSKRIIERDRRAQLLKEPKETISGTKRKTTVPTVTVVRKSARILKSNEKKLQDIEERLHKKIQQDQDLLAELEKRVKDKAEKLRQLQEETDTNQAEADIEGDDHHDEPDLNEPDLNEDDVENENEEAVEIEEEQEKAEEREHRIDFAEYETLKKNRRPVSDHIPKDYPYYNLTTLKIKEDDVHFRASVIGWRHDSKYNTGDILIECLCLQDDPDKLILMETVIQAFKKGIIEILKKLQEYYKKRGELNHDTQILLTLNGEGN